MSEYGSIVFLSRDWLPVALGVAALVILVSLWGYGRARLPMRLKLAGITLKTLGIALLCFCLLEPQWVRKKAKPGANIIAVLADNSQGMAIRDAGSTTSRAEELAKALKPEPGDWQEALDENFQIRRYTFDTRLWTTDDFDSLDFKGRAIYYVGPVDPVMGEVVGPAGPTTATRMDKFTETMLDLGLLAMIGKAERGHNAVEVISRFKVAYLMATGGAAYLVSRAIKGARVVAFEDLGMEAIYEFEVEDMPVTVAVDAAGNNVHTLAPAEWRRRIAEGEFEPAE